jgi:hypothetical protein
VSGSGCPPKHLRSASAKGLSSPAMCVNSVIEDRNFKVSTRRKSLRRNALPQGSPSACTRAIGDPRRSSGCRYARPTLHRWRKKARLLLDPLVEFRDPLCQLLPVLQPLFEQKAVMLVQSPPGGLPQHRDLVPQMFASQLRQSFRIGFPAHLGQELFWLATTNHLAAQARYGNLLACCQRRLAP